LSHPTNLILMVVVASLYFVGFAFLLRALIVWRGWPSLLGLPVAFVCQEFCRRHLPLEGYPWLLLGYSQHDWPQLLQCSDLAGVYGVSFLLALSAGAVDDFVREQGRPFLRRGRSILVFVALILVAVGYGSWRLRGQGKWPLGPRLLLVQPNLPQALKDSATQQSVVLQTHLQLMAQALADTSQPVDGVLWSETMMAHIMVGGDRDDDWGVRKDGSVVRAEEFLAREQAVLQNGIQPLAPQRPFWFLAGVAGLAGSKSRDTLGNYNSAILWDSAGQRRGLYHKTLLVPGGEYVPYFSWFPEGIARSLRASIEGMAGFFPDVRRGEGPEVFELPFPEGVARAGMSICFEIVYPDYHRGGVREGADLLINLSNEAWFPDSSEFAQYTAMARFRSAELKRSLVRVANSGTSALIDPYGAVTALDSEGQLHDFAGTLYGRPQLCSLSTLYGRWGDWLPWLCVALAGVLLLRGASRATNRSDTGPA
jgi:apolipoprotein N-acyltransferase